MSTHKLSYGVTEFTTSGFGKLPFEFQSFESAKAWVSNQKANARKLKDIEAVDYDIIPYRINTDGSSTPTIVRH
jgi:hypothetical protein